MEMTITRALNQLTLLDKRIAKATYELRFVARSKKSSEKVILTRTRQEFIAEEIAKFQSVNDLIALRQEIKAKIVLSNANTIINVAGKDHTVAEAIELKSSIKYKKELLDRMKYKFSDTSATINHLNEEVESKALDLLKTIVGKDIKNIKIEDNEIAKNYYEEHSYELVNPLDVETKISELDKYIDTFESTIDYVLSESNATTKITISSNPDTI